jgi:hypothetical protein
MNQRVIFDGRNLFDPGLASRNGYLYRGIGRVLARPQVTVEPCPVPSITSDSARISPTAMGLSPVEVGRKRRFHAAIS